MKINPFASSPLIAPLSQQAVNVPKAVVAIMLATVALIPSAVDERLARALKRICLGCLPCADGDIWSGVSLVLPYKTGCNRWGLAHCLSWLHVWLLLV
jgi:hypothetical protein